MVKIIHRPEPPPDIDSSKAVRKTDTFLNREASAGLFQKALVKAQGQEQAVEHSKLAGSGQQQQIESDSDSVLGAKTGESLQALNSEKNASTMNSALHDLETADVAELEQTPDEPVDTSSDEQETDASLFSTGLDSSAAYQMFENLQDLNKSAESNPHTDNSADGERVNAEQDVNVPAHLAAAHTASNTASLETQVDSLSSLSDLIDMLETSSQLPTGNEWTLLLEDDGPVSELTLSSDTQGRWNIDLLTSFDNGVVDEQMISNLRHQLDTAGIAVANIALIDAPTESTSSNQAGAIDGRNNSLV